MILRTRLWVHSKKKRPNPWRSSRRVQGPEWTTGLLATTNRAKTQEPHFEKKSSQKFLLSLKKKFFLMLARLYTLCNRDLCVICQERSFSALFVNLPCGHSFHGHHLLHDQRCPICRWSKEGSVIEAPLSSPNEVTPQIQSALDNVTVNIRLHATLNRSLMELEADIEEKRKIL